ncbi:hypothetical protein [Alcanivorax sp.]|uniref:hypothetical protein n=1 Tax=Alcanivorax sp. TaxID=1872427 RepID=UPI003A958A9B
MTKNAAAHGIYPCELAKALEPQSGEKWRPSNGTEGEMFIASQCDGCKRWNGGDCKILLKTMFFDVEDEDYPPEWCYGDDGQPKCAAFREKSPKQKAVYRCKQTKDMFGGEL